MGFRSFEQEPDEDLLLETNPHWITVARVVVLGVAVLAACGAGFLLWKSAPVLFGAFLLLAVVLDVLFVAARLLSWRSTTLVVTTKRILYHGGLLRRSGREIPIGRVQDVSYTQPVLGRLLGFGDLTVESAGAQEAEPFRRLRRPLRAQRAVNNAVESRTLAAQHGARPAAIDVPEQIERLDGLRRRGVVTDAEFEAKKAELLAHVTGSASPVRQMAR